MRFLTYFLNSLVIVVIETAEHEDLLLEKKAEKYDGSARLTIKVIHSCHESL